jgi:VWFA-related protein
MRFFKPSVLLLACSGSFLLSFSPAYSQQPTPQKPAEKEEVVRIDTNLIQTDLMVFDKQGRFIDGLKREQFEVKVDNKPQPISILEQVRSGSPAEEAQRAKAFGDRAPLASKPSSPGAERGRTVIFFIDDLHLSGDSLVRTRSMLNRFIDNEMEQNDQVVIACATGAIGFLQQFTNNKTMLKAAVARLVHHPYNVHAMTREAVPMSEYAALTIERKDDPKVLTFYVEQCMLSAPPHYLRPACEVEVINRARLMLQQAGSVTVNTYGSFENLVNLASRMPGRKLSFFVSDGFLVDAGPRSMDTARSLFRIIDKARLTGVVVYTIDARGLVSGAQDATTRGAMDGNGRLESMTLREVAATQDALNALARDTGGRALRNQNYFDGWVNKVLDDTSNYYLLAWYFEGEEQNKEAFKNIKVQVIDHPEYEVRLPRGFIRTASVQLASAKKIKPQDEVEVERAPEQEIKEALNTIPSRKDIPVSLSAVYLDTPDNGLVLTASVQVINEALNYETMGDKRTATVDLVGLLFDDKGRKAGNFQTRLSIDSLESGPASPAQSDTIYNYRTPLKPGLYQIRVAARERSGGRIGSATQWIELPDLTSKKLAMSSLLLGIENIGASPSTDPAVKTPQVQFSVDHNFSRTTPLRFITFIYNALRSDNRSAPDLDIQAQILRAGQLIMTIPLRKVTAGQPDPGRIPYGDEIQLNFIPPGRYTLQIKVTDRAARSDTVQETDIVIQ